MSFGRSARGSMRNLRGQSRPTNAPTPRDEPSGIRDGPSGPGERCTPGLRSRPGGIHDPRDQRPAQALRFRPGARRGLLHGQGRRGLRVPRRERRRQDNDDADRPRLSAADEGTVDLGRTAAPIVAAADLGLHARGARPLPADAGPGAAGVLRLALRRPAATGRVHDAMDVAAAVPDRRRTPTARRRASRRATSRRSSSSRPCCTTPTCCSWTSRSPGSIRSTSRCSSRHSSRCGDRGKTLVFSTHQLDMAEELCDRVAIIDHGRIVTAGPTRDVRRSTGHQVVRVATAAAATWPGSGAARGDRHATRPGLHGAPGRSRRRPAGESSGGDAAGTMSSGSRSPIRRSRRSSSSGSARSIARSGRWRRAAEAADEPARTTSAAIARREFLVRVRTRSFVLGTLLLVVGVVAIAFVPVIVASSIGRATQRSASRRPTEPRGRSRGDARGRC